MAVTYDIQLDDGAITTVVGGYLFHWLAALMDAVAMQAIRNAPKKTGTLANSIGSRVEGSGLQLTGYAYADAAYAAPVHEGARPHPIEARNARVLRFPSSTTGAIIFRRRVNHPGNQPNRFLLDALMSVTQAATAGGAN